MVAPELVQQIIASISPVSPGGRRITPREFQQIMATLTGIVAGTLTAGMVGMLTGAVAGRFSRETAFGIREIAGLPIPVLKEAEKFIEDATKFQRFLEARGFETRLFPFADVAVVDFWHPRLRRKLEELGRELKVAVDPELYAGFSTKGSIEFKPAYIEGDVPIPLARVDKGHFYRGIKIPPGISVEEVHPHAGDSIPAVHLHIFGREIDPEELAKLIGDIYEVSAEMIGIFTDTGTQIESLTDRELWLELMEAFEEARSRAYKRTHRR